jgi:hypothetical protein
MNIYYIKNFKEDIKYEIRIVLYMEFGDHIDLFQYRGDGYFFI